MITEERKSVLVSQSKKEDYLSICHNAIWPSIRASGGRVVCMLSGLIGKPTSHMLQMTSYDDLESWQTSQGAWSTERESFLEEESVRLLKPVAERPKDIIPPEDRRPVYGYRKFLISPSDLNEFVTCSEEGIWPRLENLDACVLGMWTTMASTSPLEVILLTGYHGPCHWEQTRFTDEQSGNFDFEENIWDREKALRDRRIELTQNTWVELMRSTDF